MRFDILINTLQEGYIGWFHVDWEAIMPAEHWAKVFAAIEQGSRGWSRVLLHKRDGVLTLIGTLQHGYMWWFRYEKMIYPTTEPEIYDPRKAIPWITLYYAVEQDAELGPEDPFRGTYVG